MFRIDRVTPFKLPSILGWLGPLRLEFFLGQLSGQEFINVNGVTGNFQHAFRPQPMIHGERFTFKPTRNFEFGFSRTVLFAGKGVPFTLRAFEKSLLSLSRSNGLPGTTGDPGDRRSGMDWSYRVPRMRDRVTFYGDAFADDQISPIAYWDRSAIRAGLYFSHVPGIPKLDLRAEGVYTDLPAGGALSHGLPGLSAAALLFMADVLIELVQLVFERFQLHDAAINCHPLAGDRHQPVRRDARDRGD